MQVTAKLAKTAQVFILFMFQITIQQTYSHTANFNKYFWIHKLFDAYVKKTLSSKKQTP